MGRWFNTAGPCLPQYHYMVPALCRLPAAPGLVDQLGYFVVHAPRQTGKTTAIRALADELTAAGRYAALAFTCETGRAAADNYAAAQMGILAEIRLRAAVALPAELQPPPLPDAPDDTLLREALAAWAAACPRPLVLFFDEIDALAGQSLISVLSQLRAGYNERPAGFPASVILCGLRDVRDFGDACEPKREHYKIASGGDPSRLGTVSPFNIKLTSLRLGNFTADEVRELYGQYTAETGQRFEPDAVERAIELTAGQPWLVNALAREVVEGLAVPVAEPVAVAHLDEAKERLILERATHLDSLAARLAEPRVRRVIEPVLAGTLTDLDEYDDDMRYVRDLGLVAPKAPARIANPIYHEVIVRVMASAVEENVVADPRSFVLPDGRLDFDKLLREFAEFWLEHGEVLADRVPYHEAAAQLVIMGFLQRIVNGGGHVEREYGIGRGRIDLLVRWPYDGPDGKRHWQREALELKVWRPGQPDPQERGLVQLDGYLDRLGLDRGVLVVFDRRPDAPPITERAGFGEVTSSGGRKVTILRA